MNFTEELITVILGTLRKFIFLCYYLILVIKVTLILLLLLIEKIIIKNSILTFLMNLLLAFYLFMLISGSFLFWFPFATTFISTCAIHLPEMLFCAVCSPHCPLMAYVFKPKLCLHKTNISVLFHSVWGFLLYSITVLSMP